MIDEVIVSRSVCDVDLRNTLATQVYVITLRSSILVAFAQNITGLVVPIDSCPRASPTGLYTLAIPIITVIDAIRGLLNPLVLPVEYIHRNTIDTIGEVSRAIVTPANQMIIAIRSIVEALTR